MNAVVGFVAALPFYVVAHPWLAAPGVLIVAACVVAAGMGWRGDRR